jgi:hypothetical protein
VVLDLAMPGLNGLDLQEALTKDGEASMPIIFLTGKADVPDSVRAMKRGAADFPHQARRARRADPGRQSRAGQGSGGSTGPAGDLGNSQARRDIDAARV